MGATAVIKTSTVAVARAAPSTVISGASFSSFYNQSASTLQVGFMLSVVSGTRPIISFDDGTANEQILLYASGTSLKLTVIDGGVTQADITIGTVAANTAYTCAFRVQANSFAGCLGGGTVQTDSSGTMPTVDRMRIGEDFAANRQNGWVRTDSYYGQGLPNATIQALSAA